MECGQFHDLMSAFLDGELPVDDAALMEGHLENCPDCQIAHRTIAAQDAAIRSVFEDRRQVAVALAGRVNEQLRRTSSRRDWPRWTSLALSAAAGFLLAVGLFRPWQRPTPLIVLPPPSVAEHKEKSPLAVIVAKEPIEVLLPGETNWQTRKVGQAIDYGCRIRTTFACPCEIQTSDTSEIRLNGNTELTIPSARRVELASGQIMAKVAKDPEPFQVSVAATTITAVGTEFDISCKPKETTLLVLEGSTSVAGKDSDQFVKSGEFAKIVDGRITTKEQVDPMLMMLTTRWVNEILVMKGRDNPELTRKIDDILAQLGMVKGEYLGEQEIRSLGDRCVLPLTRYLQSPRSLPDDQTGKRSTAARILSDLAQPWSIPDLIQLLGHQDGTVRFHAAKALERLTGVNQGQSTDAWRRNSLESTRDARNRWQDWWRGHKDRYQSSP